MRGAAQPYPSLVAGDISQPAWLCSASLHVLCPDLAQVNLPVACPVSCLCWSISPARSAVVWGSAVGAGGVDEEGHSEGSAHPLQSGPPETTTLQLSRPISWPGAHAAGGGFCDRDSARLGAGG